MMRTIHTLFGGAFWDPLIIIGVQRYDFFLYLQAHACVFLYLGAIFCELSELSPNSVSRKWCKTCKICKKNKGGISVALNVEGGAPSQPLPSVANGDSLPFVEPEPHSVAPLKTPVAQGGGVQNGPKPQQEVVVRAVRKAVSAATIFFTTVSIVLFFFIRDPSRPPPKEEEFCMPRRG